MCAVHMYHTLHTVVHLTGNVMCIGGTLEVRTTGVQVNMSGSSTIQSMSSTLFTFKNWLTKNLCVLNGADRVVGGVLL